MSYELSRREHKVGWRVCHFAAPAPSYVGLGLGFGLCMGLGLGLGLCLGLGLGLGLGSSALNPAVNGVSVAAAANAKFCTLHLKPRDLTSDPEPLHHRHYTLTTKP
jgi:hypothetical protein